MKKLIMSAFLTIAFVVNSAVVVEPTSLTLFENGSSAQYRIYLDSTPSAGEQVTVTPSSGDLSEVNVSGAVVFDENNYQEPQYINVSPVTDGINDGDVFFNVDNAVSSNLVGGNYDGASASSVGTTNANVDGVPVIIVSPLSGFFITEGASQIVNFSANNDSPPSQEVTINVSTVSTEVNLSTNTIVLNSQNNYSFDLTVTAIDDMAIDGDLPFQIVTDPAQSSDLSYDGQNTYDINGYTLDNDDVSYNVNIDVTGLAVGNSVSFNNGTDNLVFNSDGLQTISTLPDGSAYNVSITLQPSDQTCYFTNSNSGNLNGSDVTVNVTCSTRSVSLDTNSIDFGNVFVGSSQSSVITVTNDGVVDVSVTGLNLPSSPFSITGGTCTPQPVTLVAGQSCTIQVAFIPNVDGSFSDTFDVISDATSSPDSVNLSGSSYIRVIPAVGSWSLILMILGMLGIIYSRRKMS